jgi:hypothetical protein
MKSVLLVACCSVLALPAAASADTASKGKLFSDIRLRIESIDQDGFAEKAQALTLRSRLGYETPSYNGFTGLLEIENITAISKDYNDTINGKTAYPVVADPEDTAINRAYIQYSGQRNTKIVVGRQTLGFDNQRFVGSSAWRQNDTTYDGISLKADITPKLTANFALIGQVNRIFGTKSAQGTWDDTDIKLFNLAYKASSNVRVIGYVYDLDMPDAVSLSSRTQGVRFEGVKAFTPTVKGAIHIDIAQQSDAGSNPSQFNLAYLSVEPSIAYNGWVLKYLYESKEGDGSRAFQFPLGTNHAFDGWADKFLTTPNKGLVDQAISIAYVVKSDKAYWNGTKLAIARHTFSSDLGGVDYGSEWDLSIEQTFANRFTAGMKIANYSADTFGSDTLKVMPYFGIKF